MYEGARPLPRPHEYGEGVAGEARHGEGMSAAEFLASTTYLKQIRHWSIDPDGPLPRPVAAQLFKPVAGWFAQIRI